MAANYTLDNSNRYWYKQPSGGWMVYENNAWKSAIPPSEVLSKYRPEAQLPAVMSSETKQAAVAQKPADNDPVWSAEGESKLAAAWAHMPLFFLPVLGPLFVYLIFKGKETKFQAIQAIVWQIISMPLGLALFFGIGLVGGAVGMGSVWLFGKSTLSGVGTLVGGGIALFGFLLMVIIWCLPFNAVYYVLLKGQKYNYRVVGKFLRKRF
jgi:hypothetical protein